MGSSMLFSAIATLLVLFSFVRGKKVHPLVECETTKGTIKIEVYHDWAPRGAERFLSLVKDGFYTDIAFFRAVKGFLVQFGISDKPEMQHWHTENIPDDPNRRLGIYKNYVSFAGSGPNSRNTQLFVAYKDLDYLGESPWETPFGEVIEGEDVLQKLYKGYGDFKPNGKGPEQKKIRELGNAYIRDKFPKIDFLQSCRVVVEGDAYVPRVIDHFRLSDEEDL